MTKKFRRQILGCIAILLALFLLGCLVVYGTQYVSQRGIIDMAQTAAEAYDRTGSVDTEGLIHSSLYLEQDGQVVPLLIYEAPEDPAAHETIARAQLAHHSGGGDRYGLRIRLFPLSFTAFAKAGTSSAGSILAVRSIQYAPAILITFGVIYLLSFLFIVGYMYQVWRMNRRVAEIYERYIANISHELKTPIASIQVITETLSEGFVQEEAERARYYGIIDREARRLQRSVQDIIALSAVQDHRLDFTKRTVSLRDVIGEAAEQILPQCEDREISLAVMLPDGEKQGDALPAGSNPDPLYARTNPDRLLQVLGILLENAVKYVEDGGRIEIGVRPEGRKYLVSVRDDGCGIASEDLPYIFDRFYRCRNSAATQGSGLGLAIAREIMRSLGEEITAESETSAGACFTFTVRRA